MLIKLAPLKKYSNKFKIILYKLKQVWYNIYIEKEVQKMKLYNYFIKEGSYYNLYRGGISCNCYFDRVMASKENKKWLLQQGYIEVK